MTREEPKQTKSEPLYLIPPEGDENVGRAIFTIVEKIIEDKDKKGLLKWWKRCYELARNKFWKQSSDKVTLTTANLIYTHMQRVVNQLTDNNPKFDVIPEGAGPDENSDTDKYDIMQKTADYWWQETEQQGKFQKSVRKGETYGIMIEKMIFNPDLNNGQGEVETVIVDPFHFGVWPLDLTEDIQKAEAVFHYRPMSVREIKRKYGDKASEVIADEEFIDKLGEERKSVNPLGDNTSGGYSATIGSTVKTVLSNGTQGTKTTKDNVLVVECWYRDTSTVDEEETIEGGKKVTTRPKYKGGIRKIVTCNCGKVILEDSDNPNINPNLPDDLAQQTYLWDKFPFPAAPSIEDTESFWGITSIEHLYPLQAEINVTLTQIKTLKDKSARRKLKNPLDSGVSNDQLTNTVGIINPSNAMVSQGIGWMEDPKPAYDLYQHLEVIKALFFLVSGAFDMDQAKFGENAVVAYKALTALLERSAQINHDKQRNGDKLLRERGRMYIALMQNWYVEERFISYEDTEGQKKTQSIIGKDLIIPAKLMVVSGSTLPVSVSQKREEAIANFKMGAIDDVAYLKAMGVENYMDIITRKRQGAYAELTRRLTLSGMPQAMLMYVEKLAMMDKKEFDGDAKGGKIPPFAILMQQQQPQEDPMQNIEMQKKQLEGAEISAKVAKTTSEAREAEARALKTQKEVELIEEKKKTEVFDRIVKAEGVKMDYKKLDQMAAELVFNMEVGRQDVADRRVDRTLSHVEHVMDVNAKKEQGAYQEKGLKSNNKETEV